MQVITNEVCRGNINVIRWSPDSEFVAASCLSEPSDSVAAIVHIVRYVVPHLYFAVHVLTLAEGLQNAHLRTSPFP